MKNIFITTNFEWHKILTPRQFIEYLKFKVNTDTSFVEFFLSVYSFWYDICKPNDHHDYSLDCCPYNIYHH